MKVVKVETNEQLQDAFSIRKKVFVEEQHVPYELEIDEFEDDAAHFVIYDEVQPIGAGRFRIIEGNGKVERICILPPFRGTGAGNRMMNAIEEYAHVREINVLKLNSQTSAIPFYEKLGYHIVSDEFMDAGIPHKTMKKELV